MESICLIPVGNPQPDLLLAAKQALAAEFDAPVSLSPRPVDPGFAWHAERRQYHSTLLLPALLEQAGDAVAVGVTEVDLYVPILTFVFGEAEHPGRSAIASYHRLRQEFYGLEPDPALLTHRLIKEVIHETAHTRGLSHCPDYDCVMASSHSVEWVDVKGAHLCRDCRLGAHLTLHAFEMP